MGLRQLDLKVLSHPKLKYFKIFHTGKYVPIGPIINSTFQLRNLHRRIVRLGLNDFLASEMDLKKLEKVLDKRVKNISFLLLFLRIKYLILQNEHSPMKKILSD